MARITAEQAGQELEFLSGTFVVSDLLLYFSSVKWIIAGLAFWFHLHFPLWVLHEAIPIYLLLSSLQLPCLYPPTCPNQVVNISNPLNISPKRGQTPAKLYPHPPTQSDVSLRLSQLSTWTSLDCRKYSIKSSLQLLPKHSPDTC